MAKSTNPAVPLQKAIAMGQKGGQQPTLGKNTPMRKEVFKCGGAVKKAKGGKVGKC